MNRAEFLPKSILENSNTVQIKIASLISSYPVHGTPYFDPSKRSASRKETKVTHN